MITPNRIILGKFEFEVDFGTFRYVSQRGSDPGWDFNFTGKCIKGGEFFDGRIGLYCEAATLPLAKREDYTGVELDLPGSFDEETGDSYFMIWVGEGYEVSDVRLRFAERNGGRYRIEISGTVCETVFGHPERFELSAWADEQPDGAYGVSSPAAT